MMTDLKLPELNEVTPRQRQRAAQKPASQKQSAQKQSPQKAASKRRVAVQIPDKVTEVPETPAQPQAAEDVPDLRVTDQLARAQQARAAAQAALEATLEPQLVPEPVSPAPVAGPVPPQETDNSGSPLIVDESLVNILKSVRTIRMSEFSRFLDELSVLSDLWRTATTEAAKRRYALSLLLLVNEQTTKGTR